MQCMKVLAAVILCTVVSGQEYAGSAQCGCLEVPATSTRRRDKFCRPHLTDPAERRRYRSCVCRLGLVRNSWGDCITRQECTSCKCFPDRDFNVCGRECPLVCNEPMSRSCSKSCAFGCDCVSGFVRNSRQRGRCVKAVKCGFTCPQFSSFQFCSSTCRPKCGRRPRRYCVTRCTRGDCVCNQGYAEVEHNGETICVPHEQCSQYMQVAPAMTPGGHGNISSGGAVFMPGTPTLPVNPVVVTGGAVAPSSPGSVGIIGNLGAGGSSGATVFAPVVSTPVISGAAPGGTAGTPAPGSVGNNGNISGGVSSGGMVFIPGAPFTSGNSAFVTGGGAGTPAPGSVSLNEASPISRVPTGGIGGVAPIVGGGNQAGSFGTGSVPPITGGTGIGSVGTYPLGGVAAGSHGAIDTHGRPSRGTNGFGTVGVGIPANTIRSNGSMQSGEDTDVDPLDIPEYQEGRKPSGAPAAAGTTPSNGPNGNSGPGLVTGRLPPGGMQPKRTENSGLSNGGLSSGLPDHVTVGSSFPARPGISIGSTRLPGKVMLRPGSPISSGPAVSIETPGGTVTVSTLPSVTSLGAGTVSNVINGNAGLAPSTPSTSLTTIGRPSQPVGTSTATGTSLGNIIAGVIGNGIAKVPQLTPAGPGGPIIKVATESPNSISVTGISPPSSGMGSASANSPIGAGSSSVVTGVTISGGTTSSTGISGVSPKVVVPETSMRGGIASPSSLAPSSVAAAGGVNGVNISGLKPASGALLVVQPAVVTPLVS